MTQKEVEKALIDKDLKVEYNEDLFDISIESFTKNYEFIQSLTSDDMVKHKNGNIVYKVLYKQDNKVRLLKVSTVEAMDKFSHLRGAMTKILLENGFKPD